MANAKTPRRRAWIMMVRRHSGTSVENAYDQILALKNGEWGERISAIFTLLGHVDVSVVSEADSVEELASFVHWMRGELRASVLGTHTMLAIDKDPRDFPKKLADSNSHCLVGVMCTPGRARTALHFIRGIGGVLIADAVWGDFDIVALVQHNHPFRKRSAILRDIADCEGVERTVTMIEDRSSRENGAE